MFISIDQLAAAGCGYSRIPKRVGRLKEVLGRLPYFYDLLSKALSTIENGDLVPFRRR